MSQMLHAIGLMSGTSLDGIDAALIRSDGERELEIGTSIAIEYSPEFRQRLHHLVVGGQANATELALTEHELTLVHAKAVEQLLLEAKLTASDVDLIGFHGQTIAHDPASGYTLQIGDGALLAKKTSINVVCDFRSHDVAAGGQGAPLVPLYHSALISHVDIERPVAIVNIGGVANVTYVDQDRELLSFDTGPGNALINDLVNKRLSVPYDKNGSIAQSGIVNHEILQALLSHDYFIKAAPKSLDRQDFSHSVVEGLSTENAAATLTEFTAASIAKSQELFSTNAERFYICGGGRHNEYLMQRIQHHLADADVEPIDSLGYEGDMIEAQAFAYLAIRSANGLATSLPQTTGAAHAVVGGVFYRV